MVTTSADTLRIQTFDRQITTIRTGLDTASEELVSGKKVDLGRQLGGLSGEYNLVVKAVADINAETERLSLAQARLGVTYTALEGIGDRVDGLADLAYPRPELAGVGGQEEAKKDAVASLKFSLSILNSSHGSRRLFAGDEVFETPLPEGDEFLAAVDEAIAGATTPEEVDAAITAFFADGGAFDTEIYQGGAGQAAGVRLQNGTDVSFDVKANDPVLKDFLEGLTRIVVGPLDDEQFAIDASNQLRTAQQDLIGLTANVGRQQSLVDEALELGEAQKIILETRENDLGGVDAFEAANRVQLFQNQLQVAYTVAARLNQLSFVNFL